MSNTELVSPKTKQKCKKHKGFRNTNKKFHFAYSDIKFTIYQNDLSKILSIPHGFKPNTIDAVVTDPPYGISFQNKKWDYKLPSISQFKKLYQVLKPGGSLLCFSSPKNQHRMATNIEKAGFEIRDCIMWLYGSGFPKSQELKNLLIKHAKKNKIPKTEINKTIELFEGWRSHALKPAYEPIIFAMKPLEGNYAENAIKHHISGLNIENCRLEFKGKKWEKPRGGIWKTNKNAKAVLVDNTVGRFPTNIIYEYNEDVIHALIKSIDNSMKIVNKEKYITRIFYCAKVKGQNKNKNTHPTIKPVSLMRYLCRLVKSPDENCTILDPFMGSGTTGVACINENINFIGIEKEKEYFQIAKNRLTGKTKEIELMNNINEI
ncbi:MAG: DNA-methyltransferase [bacterium]